MEFIFKENHIEADFEYGKLIMSGDEEFGIRPYQLLVSSIASCSGIVYNRILKKQRIEIESLVISAEVERNEEAPNEVTKIALVFTVTGKDLNEKRLLKNLDISHKNCSMVRSVEDSIVIEERLVVVESV